MKVLQKFLQLFSALLLAVFCVGAMAYTPRALPQAYGLFLDSSPYSIPKEFWSMKSSTNRVLKPYSSSGKSIESHASFRRALMGQYEHLVYQKVHRDNDYKGYPSIYEYRDVKSANERDMFYGTADPDDVEDPENQCVAFAKRMTKDVSGTSSWYASRQSVMSLQHEGSDAHRGKMVAFFSNKNLAYGKHPKGVSLHVGIFLGYGPGGFWIADENFNGSAWYPTGEIRKHFITSGGRVSPYNADHYYFVDIR